MFSHSDLKQLILETLEQELLLEGGAGGHMRHPFDIADVKTGADLIKKFEQIAQEIEGGNLPDTKIDGTNTSIKVVNGEEFAMDRGSSKAIDVEGITVDRLPQRFKPDPMTGKEHGMIAAGKNVLGIFNDDFDKIKPELKDLGMLDDPTKFFNMEYVKGTTNVLAYDHDFLKIHGVNQFYQKNDRRGNPVRGGLERPISKETGKPIKDPSVPVAYDQKVMDSLVQKLNKSADKYGFKVYSSIPSKATGGFDFSPVMNVSVPVTLSDGNIEEKTLGERLKDAKNRIGEKVQTADGKKPPAQGKQIYKAVLGARAQDTNADPKRQVPLDKLLANEEDYQKAIDGAVFWHATRLLGNVIMNNMEVDHPAVKGPATEHEGLVVRLSGDDFDTKITGEFILGGEATSFRAVAPEKAKDKAKTIALFPGSFKPPHKGHLSVISAVAQRDTVDEIKVIISAPGKEVRSPKITPEKAKKVFEEYILSAKITKPVDVEISKSPSPIGAAYQYVEQSAGPNENVLLLTSFADASRYTNAAMEKSKNKNKNASTMTVDALVLPACKDEGCDTANKVSATTIRNIIDKYPDINAEDLKIALNHMPDTMSRENKMKIMEYLLGEKISISTEPEKQDDIEETSTTAGIAGFAGRIGPTRKRKMKPTNYITMRETFTKEENILKEYLVKKYINKLGPALHEAIEGTETGLNYVGDAFNATRANFEKKYKLLGEEDQRTSFLINFLNKMVHGFVQQDLGEGIPPVMSFQELVDKGILTLEIGQAAEQFTQSALEEQDEDVEIDVTDEIEGIVPDEDAEAEAEKEKEEEDKLQRGLAAPDAIEEPVIGTNETGNRTANDYYRVDSKNVFRYYGLIGPEDVDDREKFIEFYFKNVIALAAGLERAKSETNSLPEPLNSMFQKLTAGGDIVKEPEIPEESPEEELGALPEEPPEDEEPIAISESDIGDVIKQSVIKTFRELNFS
tara:strand:- start:223 stop:3117 length:2895 start_codon:yes stop_codon:yes gene_type:complete